MLETRRRAKGDRMRENLLEGSGMLVRVGSGLLLCPPIGICLVTNLRLCDANLRYKVATATAVKEAS